MSANGLGQRRRHWVRRHPWATALLAVVFVFFALSAAFAEDRTPSERLEVVGGLVILYAPVLAVTLLVTWLLDRRQRQDRLDQPPALAGDEPPPPPAAVASGPARDAGSPLAQSEPFRPVVLADLLGMPAAEFAPVCTRALRGLGYDQLTVTGQAGDHAPDFTAIDPQGRAVLVLSRRNDPGLGIASSVVQGFAATIAAHPTADRGVILTTAEFTRSAIDLAARHEIVLVDGDDLVKLLNLLGTA